MAKFAFKLDGVLRHRQRLEREAQRALAEKLAAAAGLQDQLKRLNDDLVQSTNVLRSQHLVGSIDLSYLTAHRRYTADVTRRGTLLMQKLALAQRAVDEARRALGEAARQRKVLETLRETHLARWRAEQARRDLSQTDEVATGIAYDNLREATDADAAEDGGDAGADPEAYGPALSRELEAEVDAGAAAAEGVTP